MSQRSSSSFFALAALFAGAVAVAGGCAAFTEDPASMSAGETQQAVGAPQTCVDWWMSGQGPLGGPNTVNAKCLNTANLFIDTSVWLPGCLGNFNGRLGWARDGFFDRSCTACRLVVASSTHVLLGCNCLTETKALTGSGIELDGLTNVNGALVCPI